MGAASGLHPDLLLEVYAHFAFCRSSCHFCQYWHVVPRDGAEVDAFVDRSVATLRRYRERLGRVTAARTPYFGGGTPTALSAPQLERFLSAFGETFRVEGDFTCEGHPATLDEDKIALLARAGVNRLSMGVQSLDPAVLKAIGRVNPPLPRIGALVACAQRLGISVNLDLVLGLPEQSPASFRHDLEALLPLRADSVIVYRYLPVERLPHEIPASMRYSAVVDRGAVAPACARGRLPAVPARRRRGHGVRAPAADAARAPVDRRVDRRACGAARGRAGRVGVHPGRGVGRALARARPGRDLARVRLGMVPRRDGGRLAAHRWGTAARRDAPLHRGRAAHRAAARAGARRLDELVPPRPSDRGRSARRAPGPRSTPASPPEAAAAVRRAGSASTRGRLPPPSADRSCRRARRGRSGAVERSRS